MLQLLASPFWVGIADDTAVEDPETGFVIVVPDADAMPTCVDPLMVLLDAKPSGSFGSSGLVPFPWPPRCWSVVLVLVPLSGGGRVYPPPGGLAKISVELGWLKFEKLNSSPNANVLIRAQIITEADYVRIPPQE